MIVCFEIMENEEIKEAYLGKKKAKKTQRINGITDSLLYAGSR